MPKKTEKSHDSLRHGLVTAYYGKTVDVEGENGEIIPCHLRRNQETPVVGDVVTYELEEAGNSGVVKGIKERETMLARGDMRGGTGRMKAIAANIDHIVIVMSPPPVLSEYLIDRYLVAAELLNIQPVIVLNKVDLLDDQGVQEVEDRLQPYRAIPYPVITASVKADDGLRQLASELDLHRSVLVGPSGVGKSSIISALSGESIKVRAVSEKGAGKHTTTGTRLYHLDSGGDLIDSPGVREFNLWPVTEQEVLQGFKEFHAYVGKCRFKDCRHVAEPGCAVKDAVNDATISPRRYESYLELLKLCIKPEDQYK